MKSTRSGIYRALLLTVALATVFSGSAGADVPDFKGAWNIQGKTGTLHRVEMTAEGNSWHAVGRSKEPVTLVLNPTGLNNQWAGDLELQGKHSVKASLKSSDELLLTDLQDGETWNLTRIPQGE